jgi:hypothetical protein
MTPETAQLGLDKLPQAMSTEPKRLTWQDYLDLTLNDVFKNG